MWSSLPPALDRAGEVSLRAKIPADVDAADRLAFDLTFRQLAVGRRDGLPLDAWLWAATRFRHRPHRLTPVPVVEPPDWAPAVPTTPDRVERPALLRLPAEAIEDDGTIHGHGQSSGPATVLVAATTVNVTLRTPAEQAGLVAGLGRWLNSLTTNVQIVVSTRRVDLPAHAVRIADHANTGMDGEAAGSGLAAAALDHAEFLLDLAERLDPLARTVTIAATATGGPSPATVARRTAEHTVAER
jgi:hypothetical protein